MAPFKTYSRSNETNRMKHGISNDLCALAFKKRKHRPKKIVIADLPPATTACQLSDNSLRVTTEDSFDRLLKTCNYNSVHFKSKAGSFSDSSYNIERHCSLRITKPVIKVKNYMHSPLTKRRDKITKKNEMTYGVFNKEKSSGTSIDSSLEIEVLRKAKPLVESSLGLSDLSVDFHKMTNNSTIFEASLCKSFWNNPAICSTPIEPEKQEIIDHTTSPIAVNNSINSLILFKDVSNMRAVTPTAKAKHDKSNSKENRGIYESVNVGISGRRSNPTVSYTTTSKQKIHFTAISPLEKRISLRLRKGSRDLKDDNKVSSNSEQNSEAIEIKSTCRNSSHLNLEQNQSKPKYIHCKSPTFHLLKNGETPDITKISLCDLHMSERASQQESVSVVDETEPQIKRQVNPIYITLRNRRVLSSNSKNARRVLTFNRSSTSYEGQNPAENNVEKLNGSGEENKSSSVFSTESSYNSSSNNTDIMSTVNRRVSYITTRKQKIYFTPISSLVKRKYLRLKKDSRDLKNDNKESSNSEQISEVIELNSICKNLSHLNLEQNHSKSKYIDGKSPTFHLLKNGETSDVTEISLDDLHMSERASQQESVSVVDKTESQIERQVNPIYITLRNRKVFSGNSKKARRALTFNMSSTSYEEQNPAGNNDGKLNGSDGENKSALFSRESSYNSSCSNKTDIKSTASKIHQIKNPSICYERANLEESRNGSNEQAQNVRYERVSLSIESVNTTASFNFSEDACNVNSNSQYAVSAIEREKINSENLAYDNSDIREDTQDLGSKMNEMIETEVSSLKHNISCVSGRNTSGSAIGENENIDELNIGQSKKIARVNSLNNEPSDSESNLRCLSPFSTGPSCNNLESNFSADKTSQIQFKGVENITNNSIKRPLEVIINIRRSNTTEMKIKSLIRNNCNLEDSKNTKTNTQQSPSSECTAFAAVLEENNEENTVTSKLEPVIKIKRSNTMEDMVKSSNTNNSNLEGNGHCFDDESQLLTTSVIELEESSEYSTLMNSAMTPTAKSVNEIGESSTTENNSEENLVNGFNLDEENQQDSSIELSQFIAELRENIECATRTNSTVSANVKINLEPVVKIIRSKSIEEMLKTQSHIENQAILQASKRQNETSKLNKKTGDFHCCSVQRCLEAKPLNCAAHHDFQINDSSNNHSTDSQRDFSFALPHIPTLKLKPGKSYRRSLLQIRNSTCHSSPFKSSHFPLQEGTTCTCTGGICTCTVCKRQSLEHLSPRRVSVCFMPVPSPAFEKASSLQNYAADRRKGYNSNAFQESLLENYFENLSLTRENLEVTLEEPCRESTVTARDIVLRRCGQTEPLPFEKCYTNALLQHCHKIGEGVYGEVFLFRNQNGGTTVMKIIPIEGDQIINGEKQKKFDEIISEIIIAMELGNLRNGKKNTTAGFNELQKICCIQGKYPERLLELWELYEEGYGTENDSPEIFTKDQLYIVLELANGGKDLEAFVFNNAQQAYSIFVQTACAIAVAETALQFEHRDLHWGNILVSNCDRSKKKVRCCINGKDLELPTYGVEVAIIDFTLSRITHDGVCIYNDLSLDSDLFTATGDYQFDIYRLMRNSNGNQWQHFQPYTNVLWLHYTLDKMITAVRYKNKKTRIHKEYLVKLKLLKQEILEYKSVKDVVNSKFGASSALL